MTTGDVIPIMFGFRSELNFGASGDEQSIGEQVRGVLMAVNAEDVMIDSKLFDKPLPPMLPSATTRLGPYRDALATDRQLAVHENTG